MKFFRLLGVQRLYDSMLASQMRLRILQVNIYVCEMHVNALEFFVSFSVFIS